MLPFRAGKIFFEPEHKKVFKIISSSNPEISLSRRSGGIDGPQTAPTLGLKLVAS